MGGKKQMVARFGALSGATRVVEALPAAPSLLILNYHRIGDAEKSAYDSETFSCTTVQFEWQIRYLKQRFPIVDLGEAGRIVRGESRPARTSILLTFDDGYRDNYDEAFPVLCRNHVSATFFLPTSFTGTDRLPWWDVIAYIVKNSPKRRIELMLPQPFSFDLSPAHRAASIRGILRLFKGPLVKDPEPFIRELEAACDSARPPDDGERCFLDWDEAREMEREGMCFGSHTHTHQILSKIPYAEQVRELRVSREILERELGHPVDTLAYPVGATQSFSEETFDALRQAQYRTAFSFYSGINRPGQIDPFDVARCAVDDESESIFRLRVALRAATGRNLF